MNRWPRNKANFWETAPFFRILLPFAAGILCYYKSWLAAVPGNAFIGVTLFSFLLLTAITWVKKAKAPDTVFTFILFHVLLFAGGASISFCNDIRNDKHWFGNTINPSKSYIARVTATPAEKEKSWKLAVAVINSIDGGGAAIVTGNAFVYLQKDTMPMQLQKGDTILIPGNWERVKDAGNPFEFSYAAYCARNNILHRQWCKTKDILLYSICNNAALPLTEQAHEWSMKQLGHYLGNHKAMGLLQAMLLGDEVNLDEDLRQSYSDTGIVHIIAISGGNVAIFFVVITFLLGWLRHRKYLWIKYAIALPIVWFYVLMAGAQPSATRAAVMFSVLAFGIIMQRNKHSINQLLATAFLLLCAQPAWLFSIGFQLSFVAVLSIQLFYAPVYKWVPIHAKKATGSPVRKKLMQWLYNLPGKMWGVVAMSIAAEVLVAPLVIYYFHSFPVMFIVANFAAFLFMGFVLVAGMALVVTSAMPPIASCLAICIKWLVDVFGIVVEHLQGTGPDSFRYLLLSGYETVVLYTVIAGVAWFLLRRNKPALFTGLSAACLLMLSICCREWTALHQRRLIVYNAAHTNHVELIEGATHAVMNTDTAFSRNIAFVTRPVHTGWQAWRLQPKLQQELFCIAGKTVLLLHNNFIAGKEHFPVDYLLLNYAGRINVPELLQTYSPAVIVAGNCYTQKQLAIIAEQCNDADVAIHRVSADGAFVVSE